MPPQRSFSLQQMKATQKTILDTMQGSTITGSPGPLDTSMHSSCTQAQGTTYWAGRFVARIKTPVNLLGNNVSQKWLHKQDLDKGTINRYAIGRRKFHRVPPQTKNCTQLRTAGEARISLWEGGAAGRKEKGKSNEILIVKNVLKREDTMFSVLLVYSSWHLLLQCLTTLFCYLVVENMPERK